MPNIIQARHARVTKSEAAELCGLKTYDTALPQGWLDKFADTVKKFMVGPMSVDAYDLILSSFVWGYDHSLMGAPVPLTETAYALLKLHDNIFGSSYSDESPTHSYTVIAS
jgi:hypothetical protein